MKTADKCLKFYLARPSFKEVFEALEQEYDIFGPMIKKGQGIHSETDMCLYGKIDSFDQLGLNDRTFFSAKEIVFPVSETVFDFSREDSGEPDIVPRKKIIFAHSCDIEGFHRLDKVFLENGPSADAYYQRRRELIFFFLIECRTAFESCFCQSMGTDRATDFAVSLLETDNGFRVRIKDHCFDRFFDKRKDSPDGLHDEVSEIPTQEQVTIPDLNEKEVFDNPVWNEYAGRCLGCGRCTLVCPTCSCFGLYDAMDEKGGNSRRRFWSACQIDGFARLAGGHECRTDKGQRMRYKIMHKFHDFKERFGQHMCVGCGRCIEVCPEYIDVRTSLRKLSNG